MTSTDVPRQNLLLPKQTAFIIVDHQIAFESCFDTKAIITVESGVAKLVAVAEKIDIPIITSLVKTNVIGTKLSIILEPRLPRSTRYSRSGVNPWDDPAFDNAVHIANRQCLLIAGLSAEISLSFTALGALARGFDVFVIRDACLGFSKQSFAIAFDRLTQAGVVSVSRRQVILEWSQGNVDARLLRRILKSRRSVRHKSSVQQE